MRLRQAFVSGAFQAIVFHITKTFVLPIGMPTVTVLLGRLEGFPWFYVWIGFLASLALVFHWLVKLDEWLYRIKVKDKITFDKVRIGKKLNNLGCVEWLKLGFQFHNSALFPIEVELQSLHTMLDEKYPPNKERLLKKVITPAGRSSFFDDFAIVPFEPPRDRSVEGKIEFVVRYGRLGHSKHELSKKLQIFVAFDLKGDAKVVSHNEVIT